MDPEFIDGRFVTAAAPDGALRAISPSDLDDAIGEVPFAHAHVDAAVAAARRAQPMWEGLGVEARVHAMQRLRDILAKHEDDIAHALAREVGKPLREGRAEAKAMVAKVDISVREGLPLVADVDLDARLGWRWRAHGVMAVIGPFNFPLHLPHGHIVPALLAGNTVVFKPSEVAPFCGALYARMVADAGLPPGVLNVVQGDAGSGARLSSHDDVDGVLFTGSYAVGTKILAANATRPGRMLALELGGKNAALVLDDAPFEKAVVDVALSAFSTAGQRCTCASRLIVTKGVAERFVAALAERAEALRVGHAMDPEAFMGPLATPGAYEKFAAMQRAADAEGSACVRRPAEPAVRWEGRAPRGYYVAPRVRWVNAPSRASVYQREEIFGPDLAVYVADDLEHAVALANDTPWGLAAGVWTRDESSFSACARRLRAGCITWNAATVGASSRLPFGGVGHSGNHRPAGVFASRYCAWPVALTRGDVSLDRATVPPGVLG